MQFPGKSGRLACILFAAFILLFAQMTEAPASDRMRAPREKSSRVRHAGSRGNHGGTLKGFMQFFRTTISPVDGDRCPMYPTCSQYGEQAVAKHGSILGLLMTVDRLFHEWSETTLAPPIYVYGVRRFWDPLEENDFWFTGEASAPMPSLPVAR